MIHIRCQYLRLMMCLAFACHSGVRGNLFSRVLLLKHNLCNQFAFWLLHINMKHAVWGREFQKPGVCWIHLVSRICCILVTLCLHKFFPNNLIREAQKTYPDAIRDSLENDHWSDVSRVDTCQWNVNIDLLWLSIFIEVWCLDIYDSSLSLLSSN